ncbi:ABC transporter transmembrane domain-containing protein [Rickettsia hoogstraalii]|uniref:ABC transporter transmembrane domain-containing protein n=1 Tax=Rickettsia hoogstraalii TaxID=467174 RepID=UPI0009E50352|nr:ABC transporter ATP-binding protein [Rickettsia hoogstraalii]
MPYIFQDMMNKICNHCFNLPYTYFQNNLSGSIVGRVRGIGDNYHKMHQAIEYKLSQTLLITLFSGVTLAYINIKIFIIIVGFIAVYLPLALRFFIKLARMEQDKQDSWYNLFGIVADCITNIFTIFSFAAKQRELNKIEDYYYNVHNILTTRYYKYDLIISIILNLVYWVYLIGVFVYVIYLRNFGEISIGDITFIMSLTFLFAENSWHATMRVKDFLEDVAAFRSAFTIMQTLQDIIDKEDAVELKISKGEIIFKDISFAYKEGSSVFQSLNLHIKSR